MQATQTRYSVQEYLERETTAEFRSEYRDGEIIPMTGGTVNHNYIVCNLSFALKSALKGKPYGVFVFDLRLSIPAKNMYTYSDMMVVGTPIDGRQDIVTNPLIIAEALSHSTEGYDRSEKFDSYRTVNSFREYILIDQYKHHVEQFTKTEDDKWLLSVYKGEEAVLSLSSVEFQISLADIYENVEFE